MSQIDSDELADRIEAWLLDWLRQRAEMCAEDVDRNMPFAEYGLDSVSAVEMSQQLAGQWPGITLTPLLVWDYPTPAMLAPELALQVQHHQANSEHPADTPRN